MKTNSQNHSEMVSKSRKKLNQAAPFPLPAPEKAPSETSALPNSRKMPKHIQMIPIVFKADGEIRQRMGREVRSFTDDFDEEGMNCFNRKAGVSFN